MKNNSFVVTLVAVAVAVGAAFFFWQSRDAIVGTQTATVTGTVTYRERIALPAGSVIEVELRDVSRVDAPADVLAEAVITTTGENVPIPFALEYDPVRIDPSHTYTVFARILVDETLRWISDAHIPVLTGGNPSSGVEVVLTAASPTSNGSASVSLLGTTFRLVSYDDAPAPEGEYTVTFNDGSLAAKFCNGMGGEYIFASGVITAPMLVSTLMLCTMPEGLMDIEQAFGAALADGAAVTHEGRTLTLAGEDHTFVFIAE